MEPFDEPRIIDYIRRWYAHTPLHLDGNAAVDAESLTSYWQRDPTIAPLTGNPLLLSTLLMVHHLDGSLPTGRSQLYRRYVEGMLGLWDDRRQVTATSVHLTLEQKHTIVRGLALKLFIEEKDQVDESAAIEWLQQLLQSIGISFQAHEVLVALRERSGLIIGPGVYSFAHKSIAEFLMAETVLQGDQRDDLGTRIDRFMLFEKRNDDRWNTVTFLWAGLAPIRDVELFVEECFKARKWDLGYGILHDQYSRTPLEMRRELLLNAFVDNPISNHSPMVSWPTSGPRAIGNDRERAIPDVSMCSQCEWHLSPTCFQMLLRIGQFRGSITEWQKRSCGTSSGTHAQLRSLMLRHGRRVWHLLALPIGLHLSGYIALRNALRCATQTATLTSYLRLTEKRVPRHRG